MAKKTHIKEIITEKKHEGTYIVYDASKGSKIIASGPDPRKLFVEARKMDINIPTIEYVPKHHKVDVL